MNEQLQKDNYEQIQKEIYERIQKEKNIQLEKEILNDLDKYGVQIKDDQIVKCCNYGIFNGKGSKKHTKSIFDWYLNNNYKPFRSTSQNIKVSNGEIYQGTGFNFSIHESVKSFWEYMEIYSKTKGITHEYEILFSVYGNSYTKIIFDYEIAPDDKYKKHFIKYFEYNDMLLEYFIEGAVKFLSITPEEIMYLDSDKNNKKSCHLIIPTLYTKDLIDAMKIYNIIISYVYSKVKDIIPKKDIIRIFDHRIYSNDRPMRTIGSTKYGDLGKEIKPLQYIKGKEIGKYKLMDIDYTSESFVHYDLFLKSLCSYIDESVLQINVEEITKDDSYGLIDCKLNENQKRNENSQKIEKDGGLSGFLEEVFEILEIEPKSLEFSQADISVDKNVYIILSQNKCYKGYYCKNCEEEHVSNNPYIRITNKDIVFFGCRALNKTEKREIENGIISTGSEVCLGHRNNLGNKNPLHGLRQNPYLLLEKTIEPVLTKEDLDDTTDYLFPEEDISNEIDNFNEYWKEYSQIQKQLYLNSFELSENLYKCDKYDEYHKISAVERIYNKIEEVQEELNHNEIYWNEIEKDNEDNIDNEEEIEYKEFLEKRDKKERTKEDIIKIQRWIEKNKYKWYEECKKDVDFLYEQIIKRENVKTYTYNDRYIDYKKWFQDTNIQIVKSCMNSGKTYSSIQYIGESIRDKLFDGVIICSYRRKLGEFHVAELNKALVKYGIVFVSDDCPDYNEDGELKSGFDKFLNSNFKVIQSEALHKLFTIGKVNVGNFLLIIDESTSFADQMTCSSTHKDKIYQNRIVLSCILKDANRILALDADMDHRTFELINTFRKDEKISYHINEYKHGVHYYPTDNNGKIIGTMEILDMNKRRRYIYHDDINIIQTVMIEKLENNKKLGIYCYSKKECKRLYLLLISRGYKGDIYTSSQNNIETKEKLRNISETWTGLDFMIYNNSIGAGVSYNEIYYDNLFIIASKSKGTKNQIVRDFLQAGERIRNYNDLDVHIFFLEGNYTSNFNLSCNRKIIYGNEDAFKEYIKRHLTKNLAKEDIETLYNNGLYTNKIAKNIWNNLLIDNMIERNLNYCFFDIIFKERVINYGFRFVTYNEIIKSKCLFNDIIKRENKLIQYEESPKLLEEDLNLLVEQGFKIDCNPKDDIRSNKELEEFIKEEYTKIKNDLFEKGDIIQMNKRKCEKIDKQNEEDIYNKIKIIEHIDINDNNDYTFTNLEADIIKNKISKGNITQIESMVNDKNNVINFFDIEQEKINGKFIQYFKENRVKFTNLRAEAHLKNNDQLAKDIVKGNFSKDFNNKNVTMQLHIIRELNKLLGLKNSWDDSVEINNNGYYKKNENGDKKWIEPLFVEKNIQWFEDNLHSINIFFFRNNNRKQPENFKQMKSIIDALYRKWCGFEFKQCGKSNSLFKYKLGNNNIIQKDREGKVLMNYIEKIKKPNLSDVCKDLSLSLEEGKKAIHSIEEDRYKKKIIITIKGKERENLKEREAIIRHHNVLKSPRLTIKSNKIKN